MFQSPMEVMNLHSEVFPEPSHFIPFSPRPSPASTTNINDVDIAGTRHFIVLSPTLIRLFPISIFIHLSLYPLLAQDAY